MTEAVAGQEPPIRLTGALEERREHPGFARVTEGIPTQRFPHVPLRTGGRGSREGFLSPKDPGHPGSKEAEHISFLFPFLPLPHLPASWAQSLSREHVLSLQTSSETLEATVWTMPKRVTRVPHRPSQNGPQNRGSQSFLSQESSPQDGAPFRV